MLWRECTWGRVGEREGEPWFGTGGRESDFEMLQTSIFSAWVAALRDREQVETEPGGRHCHAWSLQVVRSDLFSMESLPLRAGTAS